MKLLNSVLPAQIVLNQRHQQTVRPQMVGAGLECDRQQIETECDHRLRILTIQWRRQRDQESAVI